MPGWGTFLGKIANWMPGREESRRNTYEKLKKQREELLKQEPTEANCRKLAAIDKRLQSIEHKAINQ